MFTGKPSARTRRRWVVIGAIAAGSVIATLLLGTSETFQQLHLKVSDLHFLVRGKKPTANIVVLAIDQKALDTFHELQAFWHPYYAEAINAAADGGAKVMLMDIAFGVDVRKYEPDHDQMLAKAVSDNLERMPVVVANVVAMNAKDHEWPIPINMIAGAFQLNAIPNLTVDPDDFIRRQELTEDPDREGNFTRSLAFRTAEKFRGVDSKYENGRLMWQGRPIPITRNRSITINYAGPPATFPFISLADFIAAARGGKKDQIRRWVAGKAVLLGPDTIDDRHSTPYYTAFGSARYNTAGVEIHASTLKTLLEGAYLLPVPEWGRIAALSTVALVTTSVSAALAPAAAAYCLAAAVVATAALTHAMFRSGMLLSTSELLVACLISVLASMAYRFLTAEKRGAFFQSAISVFVGKKFAADISEHQNISMQGSRLLLTILFSDIRGFTAFCEEKDPGLVVDLLNEYMGAMVKIIVSYHGNVNKFIGDGILAIFSDEDGTTPGDHALRAVRCGTEMAQFAGKFKTGVGIHSGMAVVGNVGSQDKMEYTVLGDTVNLASRLESMNKEMKTKLILSEATRELLNGEFETAYLAEVPIRGKTVPLTIHTAAVLVEQKPEAGTLAEKA